MRPNPSKCVTGQVWHSPYRANKFAKGNKPRSWSWCKRDKRQPTPVVDVTAAYKASLQGS